MPTIDDYLTKQIYIDKNVVTFRSLSRQFGIHVNAAKNELAQFHSNSVTPDTRSFATYLVSGEPFPQPRAKPPASTQTTDDTMEVDSGLAGAEYEEEDQDEVPITTMTLVGESDLEDAKSKYARIFSMHVYCLSPSPLNDAGLICDPSVAVYKADAVDAPASSIVLGRIVGPDVRIGKVPPPIASSSKAPEPVSRKPTLKEQSEDAKPTENGKRKTNTIKPKASGKLDWSKAKKTPESVKVKKEESPVHRDKETTPTKSEGESPKDNGKRGVKRKAAPPPTSDTDDTPKVKDEKPKTKDENPKPAPVRDIKLRKNRIVSDDEDGDEDEAPPPKPKGKGKSRASVVAAAVASVAERSLRDMMEMDDDEVENASKGRPQPKPRSEPAVPSDEDIEMATSEPEPVPPSEPERDDDEDMEEDVPQPKPKPRKKKAPKEPVPVGRNGLKKKQVKHTVITTDAKGYMKSTDVYEYESVDEEEAAAEEAKEAKKPAKGKKASATKPKKGGDDDEKKSAPKPLKPVARSNSVKKSAGTKPKAKPGAQGSLKDFFGKPKK